MGRQGSSTAVRGTRKGCGGRVEVAGEGGIQEHRAQQLLLRARTIIMGAGDGHGEGDLISFFRPRHEHELDGRRGGKRRSEGGAALPDRVKATLGVILYMANLVTDVHTKMRREALE